MNSQFPKTTRLPVHLENQQSIVFKDDQLLTEIVNKELHTTLTHYFLINNSNDVAKKLLYHQMPQFLVWNIPKKNGFLEERLMNQLKAECILLIKSILNDIF